MCMANKIIISKALKHYYDGESQTRDFGVPREAEEPDKTKSISELTRRELNMMLNRIGSEKELQRMIMEMKRNSGERDTYEEPFKIDTLTPINQLYHHGILGMKWGVRRYQNADGTRTSAGKKREGSSGEPAKKGDTQSKKLSEFSNDDLRRLNERLQLEDAYKKLTKDRIKTGESWVKKSISTAGQQALTEITKGVMLGSAKLFIKEFSPQFAEAAFNIKDKKKD